MALSVRNPFSSTISTRMSTVARTNTVRGFVPQLGCHHHQNASIARMRTVLIDENETLHTIAGNMIAVRRVTALHRLQTVHHRLQTYRHSNRSGKINSAIYVVSDMVAIANC